jgi:anti-anti-sigma factor
LRRLSVLAGRCCARLSGSRWGNTVLPEMVETEVTLTLIDEQTWVLGLVGEHDLTTVKTMEALTNASLEDAHCLIVDLSETTFIDTAMVSALVRLERRCRDRGIHFRVVLGETSNTWRVLEITGLTRMFDPLTSVAQAIASIPRRDRDAAQAG